MRQWFDRLLSDGPAYGYFPDRESSKPVLVVQPSLLQVARDLFHDVALVSK